MTRIRCLVTMACAIVVMPASSGQTLAEIRPQSSGHDRPHWIWSDPESKGAKGTSAPSEIRFSRTFAVEGPATAALLRVAGDFCQLRVEMNGRPVVEVAPYSQTINLDVAEALIRGENRIEIVASNRVIADRPAGDPASLRELGRLAAVVLSLTINEANGTASEVLTDERWTCRETDQADKLAVSQGPVESRLWGIGRRPATVDPFDNYEQWRQAGGAAPNAPTFWTAPGFEISQVRAATGEEGSWVSLAFDPQGRATIAREDKGLLRMTLSDSRAAVTQVETINESLMECRGLLYAHGALYANANNSKGLYRLRDADGDGTLEDVQRLREFPGGVGHGRNDLTLGPDGMIYAINGDSVTIPTDGITDHTSPLREARRGEASREGWAWRTDPEGKTVEVLCAGMRNPFGVAFNADGELFSYDADAEFDMGTPWYRPTRILQLVTGSDFGWRGVTGAWPPYFPDRSDFAPQTLDIGKGSPTAVLFGTATRFPEDYRRALYVLDWAYGRIIAVHLAPRGAGYRAYAETFLKGRPLNVTDLAVGPEGDLYVITGGRKTQSALYRIRFVGQNVADEPESVHEARCRAHAAESRMLVKQITQIQDSSRPAFERAWENLDSPDPIVRSAARTSVERVSDEQWRDRAWSEKRVTASIESLAALVRTRRADTVARAIDRLLELPVEAMTIAQTASLVDVLSLCLIQEREALLSRRERAARVVQLAEKRFAETPRVVVNGAGNPRQRVLDLLVQLGTPGAAERVVQAMLRSSLQEDRLFALFALRNLREGWTRESRREYLTVLNGASGFVSGEGMPRFLEQIRREFLATLTAEETAELADVLKAASPLEEPISASSRPVVKQWTMEDFAPLLERPAKRDAERGAAVFREALCVRCHRTGARGPAVGPDLTHVGGRFSRQDLLTSILTPSKVVAENYRGVNVTLRDGRVLSGRLVIGGDYRSEVLRIATDPLRPGMVIEVDKKELDAVRESEVSPMPTGLVDGFTAEEVLDLLEYLTAGKE